MRTLRVLCLTALVLATAVGATADEAAQKRAAALLAGQAAVDPALCHGQLLGIFMEKNQIGFIRVRVEATKLDDDSPGYRVSLVAIIKMGGREQSKRWSGNVDVRFKPVRGKGTEVNKDGEDSERSSTSFTRTDGGLAWVGKSGDKEQKKTVKGADVSPGTEFVLLRLMAAQPADSTYTFSALDDDEGAVQQVTLSRGATALMKVGEQEVRAFKLTQVKGEETTTLIVGSEGSKILQGHIADAPFVLRAITEAQLKAWQERKPAKASASTPTGTVALFYAAIAGADKAAFLAAIDAKPFIIAAVVDAKSGGDAKAAAAIRAQMEADWAKDSKTLTDKFCAGVFESVKGDELPKDAGTWLQFLKQTASNETDAKVQFSPPGQPPQLTFELKKHGDVWKIVRQVQHGE